MDDEHDHAHSYAFEEGVHPYVVAHEVENVGEREDDEKCGQHHAECGDAPADDARAFGADECRDVDGDGAGGALRDGKDVQQFVVSEPAALFHHLVFYHREHGVSAAEGKQPDLEKDQEHFQAFLELLSKG